MGLHTYEQGVISKKQTEVFVQMSGFRNIIAHDYEKIDYDIIYSILHEGRADITAFIKTIKTFCRL